MPEVKITVTKITGTFTISFGDTLDEIEWALNSAPQDTYEEARHAKITGADFDPNRGKVTFTFETEG